MAIRARHVSVWVAAAIVTLAALAPVVFAWTAPPPEFADLTDATRLDAWIPKWEPALGEPTSLLDLLPAGSPAVGDFNNDGLADVFVPMPRHTDEALNILRQPASKLFLNDAPTSIEQRFIDVTDVSEIDVEDFAYAASWGDADDDGFVDLFVGGHRSARLFHNDGDGTFTEVTASAGLPQDGLVLGGAWGDYDEDGDLDLFVVQFADYTHPEGGLPGADLTDLLGKSNVLLRNDGTGTFTDVSAASGIGSVARRSTSASFIDLDLDGLPDIYATNYGEPAEAWRNNGDGTFTEMAAAFGLADGGRAACQVWEDLDNDGRLDLFVGHAAGNDGLYRSLGAGAYAELTGQLGLVPDQTRRGWGCAGLDHDADGDMDLFVAAGELLGNMRQVPTLFTNALDKGQGLAFVDNTTEAGDHDIPGFSGGETLATPRAASGASVIDLQLDNAPDILTSANDGDRVHVLGNVGWAGGWAGGNGYHFRLWLEGVQSNSKGVGAIVTVSAGNVVVTRQVGAGMSYGAQSSVADLFFGISQPDAGGYVGQIQPVSVTIRWPSGQVDTFTNAFLPQRGGIFTEGGTFTDDALAPRPSLSLVSPTGALGENGWYTSAAVTLRLRAKDDTMGGSLRSGVSLLQYSLNAGATWISVPCGNLICPGSTITFTGEGTHKLWVRTADPKGNTATFLYPIRLDTGAPSGTPLSPAPGGVYVQGREVINGGAALGRALVVGPVPLDLSDGPGEPLQLLVGSDGTHHVKTTASDLVSGVWRVKYGIERLGGAPVAGVSGESGLAPYIWKWPAGQLSPGPYKLITTVLDRAGRSTTFSVDLVVVPSDPGWVPVEEDALAPVVDLEGTPTRPLESRGRAINEIPRPEPMSRSANTWEVMI